MRPGDDDARRRRLVVHSCSLAGHRTRLPRPSGGAGRRPQAVAPCEPHGLDLRVHAELGQDVLHVALHREWADRQLARDLGGGAAVGERPQDLAFSSRSATCTRRRGPGCPSGGRPVEEGRRQAARARRRRHDGSTSIRERSRSVGNTPQAPAASARGSRSRVRRGALAARTRIRHRAVPDRHRPPRRPGRRRGRGRPARGRRGPLQGCEGLRGVGHRTQDMDGPASGQRKDQPLREPRALVHHQDPDVLAHLRTHRHRRWVA